jgi:hypothetical protein
LSTCSTEYVTACGSGKLNNKSDVRFEVFTAVTMKNSVFWDVTPWGHLRVDVLEEPNVSIIRVTRIGELGTTLAVTSQLISVMPMSKRVEL